MSFLAKYNKFIQGNKLYKLMYDNKVVGFRACTCDASTYQAAYYDFDISVVKDKSIQRFINENLNKIEAVPLKEHDGLLMSDIEISNGVVINELKDASSASRILSFVISVYSMEGK